MSCRLLKLLGNPPPLFTIHYKASDDLESLFYIFLEITIVYGGLGQTSDEGQLPDYARLWCEVYKSMNRRDGLTISACLKRVFLTDNAPLYKLTPFFQACYPILEAWRKAIGCAIREKRDVSHQEICKIIDQGLKDLESFPPVAAPPLPPPTFLHPSGSPLLPQSEHSFAGHHIPHIPLS
jgi:hypothetical protein